MCYPVCSGFVVLLCFVESSCCVWVCFPVACGCFAWSCFVVFCCVLLCFLIVYSSVVFYCGFPVVFDCVVLLYLGLLSFCVWIRFPVVFGCVVGSYHVSSSCFFVRQRLVCVFDLFNNICYVFSVFSTNSHKTGYIDSLVSL